MARRAPWWPPRISTLFRGAPDRPEPEAPRLLANALGAASVSLTNQLTNQLAGQVSVQMARELEWRIAQEFSDARDYNDSLLSYDFENIRSIALNSTTLRVNVFSHHFDFREQFNLTLSGDIERQLRGFSPVFRLVAVQLESVLRPFINILIERSLSRVDGFTRLQEYWHTSMSPSLLAYTQRLVGELVATRQIGFGLAFSNQYGREDAMPWHRPTFAFTPSIGTAYDLKAAKKASALLVSCLSPLQLREYARSNKHHFSVYVPAPVLVRMSTGEVFHHEPGYYFITARSNYNVYGKNVQYCTQLEGCNVLADNMLSQKLLLEQCPENFFRVANRSVLLNGSLYEAMLDMRKEVKL